MDLRGNPMLPLPMSTWRDVQLLFRLQSEVPSRLALSGASPTANQGVAGSNPGRATFFH